MKPGKIIGFAVLAGFVGLILYGFTREARNPETPRQKKAAEDLEKIADTMLERADADLVKQLMGEDLGDRRFKFSVVMEAASGKKVIPFSSADGIHVRIHEAVTAALENASSKLSEPNSPVRGLRRINEASRFFEDLLLETLDAQPDLAASIPTTTDGRHQRSGYPDLRIEHVPSGTVFYLDPKLVEETSWDSTLRTFYFEPKSGSLKITEDAVHLLAGIPHDGSDGQWTFGKAELVDLSSTTLRLKPEFQASNRDLYPQER